MKKRKKLLKTIWCITAVLVIILFIICIKKYLLKDSSNDSQFEENTQNINEQQIPHNTDNKSNTNISESIVEDYTSYNGDYHDSNRQSATLTVSIKDNNHLTGYISDDPSGHEASVIFDTYIVDNQAQYYFDDDERGGHGTMKFSFQGDKIAINIDDYQSYGDAFLSYGIQGEYIFTNDEIINSELIEYKNLKKYDATWTYDEVDIEIQKKKQLCAELLILERCSLLLGK